MECLRLAEDRGTAVAECVHPDFVGLEVGRLDNDAHSVAQGEHGGAEHACLGLHGLAALRQLLQQRLVGHLVYVGFQRLTLDLCYQPRHVRFGGEDQAFLLGTEDGDGHVLIANQLAEEGVDLFQRDGRHYLVDDAELLLDAGEGLAVNEVGHALAHVVAVLHGVPLVVGGFDAAQVVCFGPFVFAGGEAVLPGAQHFAVEGGEGGAETVLAASGIADEGGLGLREDEVAFAHTGPDERRVGPLR